MTNITLQQQTRPIADHERPREKRDPSVARIKAELLLRMEKIERRAKQIESSMGGTDAIETRVRERIRTAAEEAKAAGKPLSRAEYERLRTQDVATKSAFDEVYYTEALEIARELKRTAPDLDQVSEAYARPGGVVWLYGTCFGPSQGKVLLELTNGRVIELDVRRWSETFIDAYVNPIIAQVPLRPHYGSLWIITGAGDTSNVWPIQYMPVYSEYIAQWTRNLRGHGAGSHEDDVFLRDCGLGDPDFSIIQVDHRHSGSGWSEKRYPFAGGRDMAQGYHIGVSWAGLARMTLLYAVRGPKGIDPPYIEPLGTWTWLGDLE